MQFAWRASLLALVGLFACGRDRLGPGRNDHGGDAGGDALMTSADGGLAPCQTADDCQLVNDCCRCAAIGKAQQAPSCDVPECLVASCSSHFINQPSCVRGRCVAGFQCDTTHVMCKRVQPACPEGQVPSVIGSGMLCYGPCVDSRECL